ncbi:hypothetical protein EAE99_005976 [Botrytis elliptica]|nr:hypothetical protein EAE99_005976 [Botrytis elliptica]
MLCALCDDINVTDLILSAKATTGASKTDGKKWKHHSTYDDIVCAARTGCELCKLLVTSLDRGLQRPPWHEVTYKEVLLESEREGTSTGFSVEIRGDGGVTPGEGGSEVLNVICFGFGEHDDVPLSLSLQTPRDKIRVVEGFQVGHYTIDPNLGSETNCRIARDWLKTCCERHYECPLVEDKELPSRVIHVGSDDQDPYILPTDGKIGKYIALSHCWGGHISIALTTQTLEEFKDKIPMAQLPANFRDAVLLTRRLGFEYLWIDCLCIMQDSSEDWEIESKHMGQVYHDATLTIAASTASKSTDGILHTFTDYELSGISISLKLSKDGAPEDHIDMVLPNSKRENLGDLLQNEPLAARGWTLQEEVLAARTLFYGHQQIYWQCLHDYEAADGLRPWQLVSKRAFRYEQIKDRIHQSQGHQKPNMIKSQRVYERKNQTRESNASQRSRKIIEEYHKQMVVDYCSRNLTRTSDKFIAFSGIVTLVRDVLWANGFPNSLYIAGIWSSHFRHGLIWYYKDDVSPSIQRAPSWSWATTNGKIAFNKTAFNADFTNTDIDPILISHDVKLAGQNPFGEIKMASIVLSGSIMIMRGVDDIMTNKKSKPAGYIHWDVRKNGTGRRKTAFYICRLGKSSMFLYNPHPRESDLANGSGPSESHMEPNKIYKANNIRYKVLFIAKQGRQAHGLVLEHILGNVEDENRDGNEISHAILGAANADRDRSHIADTNGKMKTYRRVGYVWFSEQHANGNQYFDSYKWAEYEGWERETFDLM